VWPKKFLPCCQLQRIITVKADSSPDCWKLFFVLARDLLFPFNMAMALLNGIPFSMVHSPGPTEFRSINC